MNTKPTTSVCLACGKAIPPQEQGKGKHPHLCYSCSRTPAAREKHGGPDGTGVRPVADLPGPHTGRWRAWVRLSGGGISIISSADTHTEACQLLSDHVATLPPYVLGRIANTGVRPVV